MTLPEPAGYLGRVLKPDGAPAGTCFQVTPGVLATAWHVANTAGAGQVGDVVSFDSLASSARKSDAVVHAVDPVHDLVVLTTSSGLMASVAGLVATDSVPRGTAVGMTGVAHLPGVTPRRWLDATGSWRGRVVGVDGVAEGRIECGDAVPGMSGTPVQLPDDHRVVGVVRARYRSADGYMVHTVWVSRTEDLIPLLTDVCDVWPTHGLTLPVLDGPRVRTRSLSASSIRYSPATAPYLFDGNEYYDARQLVIAFATSWQLALVEVERASLSTWLLERSPMMPTNILDCSRMDERLARLAAHFVTDCAPTYRGRKFDAHGLLKICGEAEAADAEAMEVIVAATDDGVLLREFARHLCTSGHVECAATEGCQTLRSAAVLLTSAADRYGSLAAALSTPYGEGSAAVFLRCLVDSEYLNQCHARLESINPQVRTVAWWREVSYCAISATTLERIRVCAIALALSGRALDQANDIRVRYRKQIADCIRDAVLGAAGAAFAASVGIPIHLALFEAQRAGDPGWEFVLWAIWLFIGGPLVGIGFLAGLWSSVGGLAHLVGLATRHR